MREYQGREHPGGVQSGQGEIACEIADDPYRSHQEQHSHDPQAEGPQHAGDRQRTQIVERDPLPTQRG